MGKTPANNKRTKIKTFIRKNKPSVYHIGILRRVILPGVCFIYIYWPHEPDLKIAVLFFAGKFADEFIDLILDHVWSNITPIEKGITEEQLTNEVIIKEEREKYRISDMLAEEHERCKKEILITFLVKCGLLNYIDIENLQTPDQLKTFFEKQSPNDKKITNWDACMKFLEKEDVQSIKRAFDLFREATLMIQQRGILLPPHLKKISNDIHNIRDIESIEDQNSQLGMVLWYYFTGWSFSELYPAEDPIKNAIHEMQFSL